MSRNIGNSGRVQRKLKKLRERFGAGVNEHIVNVDFDQVTSTRRDMVPSRVFFLGEIWWAERSSIGDSRSFNPASSHVPALVTKRQDSPHRPVELAPNATRWAATDMNFFQPREIDGLLPGTSFSLARRRPQLRSLLGPHLATLPGSEKQRLARILAARKD